MKLSKNQIKYYSSLNVKKFRDAENKFIVEGEKGIIDLLDSDYKIEAVIHDSGKEYKEIFRSAAQKNIEIYSASPKEIERIASTKSPQGILAIVEKKDSDLKADATFILALEDIQDPGNVGTIIRNADWFGVENLIVSSESADIYNPKVVRSSMGSLFRTNIKRADNFVQEIKDLKKKGYSVLCADLNGTKVRELELKNNSKIVLVVSNEAKGPSDDVLSMSDKIVSVPKFGNAESLNVANATAILLYELRNKINP